MIVYNINENMILAQKEGAFLQICKELGISTKKITEADRGRTLADILALNIPKAPGSSKKAPVQAGPLPELLIFHNEDNTIDKFLAAYRAKGLQKIDLKAVVTPFNMFWTVDALVAELQKEHEEMHRR